MAGATAPNIRKPALAVVATAILTLGIALLLTALGSGVAPHAQIAAPEDGPQNPAFSSALLWLQLVRTPEEVFRILGPAEESEGRSIRTILDTVNRVDFVFLLSYAALNLALGVYFYQLGKFQLSPLASAGWFAVISACLCCIMVVSDIAENVQLFALTAAQSPGDVNIGTLTLLRLWTALKWFALFLALFLQGLAWIGLHAQRGRWLAPLALVHLAAFALGTASLASLVLGPQALGQDLRPLMEPAAALLCLGWLIGLLHAIALLMRGPGRPAEDGPRTEST